MISEDMEVSPEPAGIIGTRAAATDLATDASPGDNSQIDPLLAETLDGQQEALAGTVLPSVITNPGCNEAAEQRGVASPLTGPDKHLAVSVHKEAPSTLFGAQQAEDMHALAQRHGRPSHELVSNQQVDAGIGLLPPNSLGKVGADSLKPTSSPAVEAREASPPRRQHCTSDAPPQRAAANSNNVATGHREGRGGLAVNSSVGSAEVRRQTARHASPHRSYPQSSTWRQEDGSPEDPEGDPDNGNDQARLRVLPGVGGVPPPTPSAMSLPSADDDAQHAQRAEERRQSKGPDEEPGPRRGQTRASGGGGQMHNELAGSHIRNRRAADREAMTSGPHRLPPHLDNGASAEQRSHRECTSLGLQQPARHHRQDFRPRAGTLSDKPFSDQAKPGGGRRELPPPRSSPSPPPRGPTDTAMVPRCELPRGGGRLTLAHDLPCSRRRASPGYNPLHAGSRLPPPHDLPQGGRRSSPTHNMPQNHVRRLSPTYDLGAPGRHALPGNEELSAGARDSLAHERGSAQHPVSRELGSGRAQRSRRPEAPPVRSGDVQRGGEGGWERPGNRRTEAVGGWVAGRAPERGAAWSSVPREWERGRGGPDEDKGQRGEYIRDNKPPPRPWVGSPHCSSDRDARGTTQQERRRDNSNALRDRMSDTRHGGAKMPQERQCDGRVGSAARSRQLDEGARPYGSSRDDARPRWVPHDGRDRSRSSCGRDRGRPGGDVSADRRGSPPNQPYEGGSGPGRPSGPDDCWPSSSDRGRSRDRRPPPPQSNQGSGDGRHEQSARRPAEGRVDEAPAAKRPKPEEQAPVPANAPPQIVPGMSSADIVRSMMGLPRSVPPPLGAGGASVAMAAAAAVMASAAPMSGLTLDQKRQLLWKSKKPDPVKPQPQQEAATVFGSNRWDAAEFSDESERHRFQRLMGVKNDVAVVAEQQPGSASPEAGQKVLTREEQDRVLQNVEAQYLAGLRRKDGRTVGLGM